MITSTTNHFDHDLPLSSSQGIVQNKDWTCGLVDSWTHGLVDSWTRGLVDSWTRGLVDSWTRGLVDSKFEFTFRSFLACPRILLCVAKHSNKINFS